RPRQRALAEAVDEEDFRAGRIAPFARRELEAVGRLHADLLHVSLPRTYRESIASRLCRNSRPLMLTLARLALFIGLVALPMAVRARAPARVLARHGMVVAQEARAARIGVEILEKGGNAVDAAVAVGFALAVTHPQAGNIGGGGFMVIHLADRNEDIAIDYRETAPAATTKDVFLDEKGEADPRKSRDSGLGIGVPGTVAGLALALERYGSGKFTLAQLIAPPLAAARNGVMVEDNLADVLPSAQPRLARWPSTAKIFLNSDGGVLAPGQSLIQADLAASLDAIARDGPRAFYQGPIAGKIVASMSGAGGLMTLDDLKAYRPLLRPPVPPP